MAMDGRYAGNAGAIAGMAMDGRYAGNAGAIAGMAMDRCEALVRAGRKCRSNLRRTTSASRKCTAHRGAATDR